MKYKLYPNSLNDLSRIQETVFKNRLYQYPSGGFDENVSSFEKLTMNSKAVMMFAENIESCSQIELVVDSDFDGYASASILYRYLRENFPHKKINYYLHEGKQHGLSDDIPWRQFADHSLVLIPDAGSNDIDQCRILLEQSGCEIIVLDHHVVDKPNHYAAIMNSQLWEYPNPYLCGTGVTWQFIRALDELYWTENADEYLEMVAMATVADIMDITVPENRLLIDTGLKSITHPLLESLANKAGVAVSGLTGIDAQFSIIPLVNAMIRVGGSEEKELLFRAFCCEYEVFDYKKRDSDEIVEENIYDRAARLCYNAKNRQKRSKTNDIDALIAQIMDKNLDDNQVIVVNGSSSSQALTGVLAAQLADKYKKPCLVLRRKPVENEDAPVFYGGSGRNSMLSTVQNFKELLESTGLFKLVAGHNNAFGVEIERTQIPKLIQMLNKMVDSTIDPFIQADFIIDADDLCFETVADFAKSVRPFCGEGFPEPIVVVENIVIRRDQVKLMGGGTSWKIITDDDVEIVKFGVPQCDLVVRWYSDTEDETLCMTAAGTIGMNQWGGILKGQLVVKEYEACGVMSVNV